MSQRAQLAKRYFARSLMKLMGKSDQYPSYSHTERCQMRFEIFRKSWICCIDDNVRVSLTVFAKVISCFSVRSRFNRCSTCCVPMISCPPDPTNSQARHNRPPVHAQPTEPPFPYLKSLSCKSPIQNNSSTKCHATHRLARRQDAHREQHSANVHLSNTYPVNLQM